MHSLDINPLFDVYLWFFLLVFFPCLRMIFRDFMTVFCILFVCLFSQRKHTLSLSKILLTNSAFLCVLFLSIQEV